MKALYLLIASVLLTTAVAVAAVSEPGTAEGTLTIHGESFDLSHAYVFREPEGFYDPADPTWNVLIRAESVATRDVDDPFIDPSLRLSLTLTSEFGDGPSLQVLSQNLRAGNISMFGGEHPLLQLEQECLEVFAGRIHLAEPQTFIDHSCPVRTDG
jgi:hypothetical protein